MFRIVSMVSGWEVLLLFSLLLWPGLGVLDWLRLGCWSDSLPNATRAFPDTWDIAVKKVDQTSATSSWYVFIEFLLWHVLFTTDASSYELYILHEGFCRAIASVDLTGRGAKKKEDSISILFKCLFKYPNCTCLSTSTSLTHRPFALAKQLWDLSLYLF